MKVDPFKCPHYDVDWVADDGSGDEATLHQCSHPDRDEDCCGAAYEAEPVCFLLEGEQPEVLIEPTVEVKTIDTVKYTASINKEGRMEIERAMGVPEDLVPSASPERLTYPVGNCARCGEDHDSITFTAFTLPTHWTHWAMCPIANEPILLRSEEETSDAED